MGSDPQPLLLSTIGVTAVSVRLDGGLGQGLHLSQAQIFNSRRQAATSL